MAITVTEFPHHGEPADDGRVVSKAPVAVQLYKIGKNILD
jgi:hypothetical protein